MTCALRLTILVVCCPIVLALLPAAARAQKSGLDGRKYHVYIGTYTGPKSQGIYRAELDLSTGRLGSPELVGEAINPSFVNIHPNQKFLYAVNREGEKQGGVLTFAIDTRTGKLTPVGKQAACGDGPCYLTADRSGQCVLVASYSSGTVAALSIRSDGSLEDAAELVQQSDDGGSPRSPHAHSINVSLDNMYAVAADAGIDKLYLYRLDPKAAKLAPGDPPFVRVKQGSGPRHFAFHPGGKFAYSNMETTSEVIAFAYDAASGRLTQLETLSTLPEPVAGNSTAEIQVHPTGKFVYVSNRGHNSIAMFAVDAQTGRLTALGNQPTGGKIPRNFGIDPTGHFLLAANQDTGNIVVFAIDPESGKLTPTGQAVEVGSPVCVKFVEVTE